MEWEGKPRFLSPGYTFIQDFSNVVHGDHLTQPFSCVINKFERVRVHTNRVLLEKEVKERISIEGKVQFTEASDNLG